MSLPDSLIVSIFEEEQWSKLGCFVFAIPHELVVYEGFANKVQVD